MTLGLLPQFVNTTALRYFYEVARFGSVQLAEERIHIASSAIRRQIQLLEEELGVKLFVRDRTGLRLTAAGETLLHRTRRAMKELGAARAEIESMQGERTGNVRIGLNETVAREFLPTFVKEFHERYPRVTFEFQVANSSALADMVLKGEVDIIVGYALASRSGLQQVASFDLQTCITVRHDHPLATRATVRVADLVDQTFIMPSSDSMLRQLINEVFSKVAVKPVSNITTDSFELIATLVSQGMGIGLQVCLFPGPDIARPDLVYVPIRDAKARSAVLGCYIASEGSANMATSLCMEELREALVRWCSRSAPPWIVAAPPETSAVELDANELP